MFEGPAPAASAVAETVAARSGLEVLLDETGPEIHGRLYDLHAHLAFAGFPKDRVQIHAYRPSGVKEHLQTTGVSDLPIANVVQGANELPGAQTIYLEGFVGEPTLFFATILALERLGGRFDKPLADDERLKYDRPLTLGELKQRHEKTRRRAFFASLLFVILLPLLLPLYALGIVWTVLTVPWRILKAHRALKHLAAHRAVHRA
jgi:hypothetical protein